MKKTAKKIIVYTVAGILLSGVGAQAVQAAPQSRDDRQQQEEQQQEQKRVNAKKKEQQQQEQQRANVKKQEQQRTEQQRSNVQRQEQQRGEEQRANVRRQNEQRAEQQRLNVRKQEQQRAEQQRLNIRRQEQQRAEQQRLNIQRQEQQRAEQRLNIQRQNDRERQEQLNRQRNNRVRRHIYNNARYNAPNWRASDRTFEHRQPWAWRSRDHAGRRLILDASWDQEFPGLRSYRWSGPGFYYQGNQYQDLVLFYDDDDSLVSIGFWDEGQFIMIRDDDRRYYNNSPLVLRYRNSLFNIRITL